jgi:hypothetical protein
MACPKVRGTTISVARTPANFLPELSTREGLKADRNMSLLKISQATAVHDLKVLVEILDMIKEQEKTQKRTNSPALAAW